MKGESFRSGFATKDFGVVRERRLGFFGGVRPIGNTFGMIGASTGFESFSFGVETPLVAVLEGFVE